MTRRPHNPETTLRHSSLASIPILAWLSVGVSLLIAFAFGPNSANAQTPVQQQTSSPILVLFDSSGSMWGKLPGNTSPKFALARRALTEQLERELQDRPSGLVIFGRSCQAATLEAPVARQTPKRLLRAIEDLNPRGKGPLGLALETAADTLPSGASADVILVHDGADNCRSDTCQLVDSIHQSHPGLRFHLLSIGLTDEDAAETRCIADKTGGKVFSADDAPSVAMAVSNLVANLTSRVPAKTSKTVELETPSQAEQPSAATPDMSRDNAGPSRIIATVQLAADGPAIAQPVSWTFSGLDGAEDTSKAAISITSKSGALTHRLAAGQYTVAADIDGLTVSEAITVPAKGAVRIKLPLQAGQLTLKTPGVTFDDGVTLTLSGQGSAGPLAARTITRETAPLILLSGAYTLTSHFGPLAKSTALTVKPGTKQTLTPFDGFGLLQIKMVDANGKYPSTPVETKIEADAPDKPSGRRLVTRSASASASHLLPAATYYVTVTVGGRTTTQQIAVPANTRVSRAFTLQAATLQPRVSLLPDGLGIRSGTPVVFTVEDLQSETAREVAWSSQASPSFPLKPGRYRISVRIGAHNVTATETLDVTASQNRTVMLKAAAAEISLKLEGQTVGRPTHRLWEVRTTDGEIIWRTNALRPNGLLAPGAYIVRCLTNQQILEGRFQVEAGTAQTIALVAD
ncbi:MAG: hypothetical protein AAFV45_06465 [Pseudomonadota bacterium]